MAGGRVSKLKVQWAERRALVVSLRVQGGSLRDIAAQLRGLPEEDRLRLGISDSYCDVHVYRDLAAELKRVNEQAAEGIEEIKRLELERLDALLASWWPRATENLDPVAFDKVMSLLDRRSRYLGLDAATKVDQTVTQVAMTLADWQTQQKQRAQAAQDVEAMVGV